MSKYIDYANAYLIIPTTLEKWEYVNNLKSLMPDRSFRKFEKWCKLVETHESHRSSKKPQSWYLFHLKRIFNLKRETEFL